MLESTIHSIRAKVGVRAPAATNQSRGAANEDRIIQTSSFRHFQPKLGQPAEKFEPGEKKVPENWVSSQKPGPLTVPHRIGSNRMNSCGSI